MRKLAKGMLVLESVTSPLATCPGRIEYVGPGKAALTGKTLFNVYIGDMFYGAFTLCGEITTLEEAQARLLAPAAPGDKDTVAECTVRYQYLHVDDNEFYGEGS